jgi:two-component system NtrC family sensor kinase
MEDKRNSTHQKAEHQLSSTNFQNNYLFKDDLNSGYVHSILNKYGHSVLHKPQALIQKKQRSLKKLFKRPHIVEDIQENFLKSVSFIDYIKGFYNIDFFSKFNTIHLFIHEKGKSTARHLEIKKHEIKRNRRSVSDFNNLFQSIKKSKNRSFGQANLKGLNFEILGTFIGREFYLDRHNVIFLLSRDEFLPQSQDDIETFNDISDLLPGHIQILLLQEYNNIQIENLKLALSKVHIPISVKENDRVIFENFDHELELSLPVIIDNKFVRTGVPKDLGIDQADYYHKERITLLGELLNTLKHELSNPLFGLKLTTELLLTEEINDEQEQFLKEISSSLDRCTQIIENFSSLYVHGNSLIQINLNHLLDEILKLSKSATRGIEKTINLDDSSSITFYSNPTWVVQILFNLIINAAQELNRMNHSKPLIKISAKIEQDSVLIRVSDNGKGIEPQKLESIFSPFYTTKEKGTGLGLYISRSLANKLGGTLEYIQDNDNSGANFVLTIPVNAAKQ